MGCDTAESARQLDELLRLAVNILVVVGPGPRFERVNPALCTALGRSAEELTAGPLVGLVHPDDRARALAAFGDGAGAHAGGTPEVELRFRHRDDSWHLLGWRCGASGADGRRCAVGRDLTERRRQEADAERAHLAVEHATNEIYIIDGTSMRFVQVNARARENLGYSSAELRGMTPNDLVAPGVGRPLAETLRPLQSGAVPDVRFSTRHRRRDGTTYPLELSVQWLAIHGERYVLAVGQDRTVQDQLEEELRHAQRLDALGRMSGAVAHDFNNLLTAILGGLELARMDLPASHRATAVLQAAQSAAQRAAELTRSLVAFARKQVLASVVAEPGAAIRAARHLLEPLLGETSRLVLDLAPDLWPIRVGAGQLEQILVNLVVNARAAMPSGGTVTIDACNRRLGAAAQGALPGPGDWVQIRVTDDGLGMAPEVRAHAFEPFFTSRAGGEGTGLGLATVYGIVRQNRGFVRIESEPGEGTAVVILWPRSSMAVPGGAPPPAGQQLPVRTVLLVDDDAAVLSLATTTLQRAGLRVCTASSGEAALELARERGAEIDGVICDVVLPGRSGITVVQELLAERPDLPALLVSGFADVPEDARAALPPGTGFLAKPFTPRALLDALAALAPPA